MAIVYRHRRLDNNEVFYIGIGKNKARAYQTINRNKYWKNIVNKTDYKIDIIFEDVSYKEAIEGEILLIKLYGRKDLGLGTLCNFTDGGEGAFNPSLETRKRISECTTGSRHGMYGKKHTEAAKKKISEASIKQNKEGIGAKVSAAKKGKPVHINSLNNLVESRKNGKQVINTITGEIFRSIVAAAYNIGLTKKALQQRMLRNSKSISYLQYY